MNNDESFGQFINKIAELLDKIHSGRLKSNEEMPKELETQLADLEKNIEIFCKINANIMSKANVSDQEITQVLKGPQNTLPDKEKQLLDKVNRLKSDAEGVARDLALQKMNIEKQKNAKNKGSFGQQRKKKFKALGGQNWIPL